MGLLRSLMFFAGAAIFVALAVNNLYALYLVRDDAPLFALRLPAGLFWTGLWAILSLACVLGAVMKPREFRQVFKEEPVQRQAWLDDLNAPKKDEEPS